MMHDEEGSQTWIPVGCTGERSADAGPVDVSCVVTGLTQDHGYGDMIIGCWGPDPLNCPNGAEADGNEESWWTPLPGNYATTTTTSMPTMATIMTFVSRTTSITPTPTWSLPSGPGFDFALSVSPSTVSVVQGGTATYAVEVMYSDPSYAGTMINVQLTGLGPGIDYGLSQNGALTITTSPTTPTGSYPFTIIGSVSGVTHQTGGTLIVTQSNSVSTAPVTITTPPTTTTSSLVATVTSVVTQTATVQSSPTSTESSISNTQTTSSDVIGLLQQNSLLIIAILVIALAAVLLSGRRRSTGPAAQTQPQTANVTYCPHCGTQNPPTNSYCRKCGAKLREGA